MPENLIPDDGWVPESCTLPTIEQPMRRAEFDELFSHDLVGVTHESPHHIRLQLRAEPSAAARAADLAVRESGCCSFFAFTLAIADGKVALEVAAAPAHAGVLAALAARAEARLGTSP